MQGGVLVCVASLKPRKGWGGGCDGLLHVRGIAEEFTDSGFFHQTLWSVVLTPKLSANATDSCWGGAL